jgi:hypothetical protein
MFFAAMNDLYEDTTINQQDTKRTSQGNDHNTSDLNFI